MFQGAEGCGKLLFHVIKGIDGQLHSCTETFLPFLIESLSDETFHETLYNILEHVIQNIVYNINPHKNELFWTIFIQQLKNIFEKYQTSQDEKLLATLELYLKLIGQSIEYKEGKFLQKPISLIEVIINMFSEKAIPEQIAQTTTKIVIIILLAKNLKLPQDQASLLTRKILMNHHKSVFLYFVEHIIDYTAFEAFVLPNFLHYCARNELETKCFHILVKIILKKAPLCRSGTRLKDWVKYNIDFKEHMPTTVLHNHSTIKSLDSIEAIDNYMCTLICLPHTTVISTSTNDLPEVLENNIIYLLKMLDNAVQNSFQSKINQILFLLNLTVECFIHLFKNILPKLFMDKILISLLPLVNNSQFLSSLETLSLCIGALQDDCEIITMDLLIKINIALERNFSSPFHEVSTFI